MKYPRSPLLMRRHGLEGASRHPSNLGSVGGMGISLEYVMEVAKSRGATSMPPWRCRPTIEPEPNGPDPPAECASDLYATSRMPIVRATECQ